MGRFTFNMRRIVVAVVFAAIIMCVVRFVVSPCGFLGNLLAELAGILVGVALALTIAENLTQRRHHEQWSRVRLDRCQPDAISFVQGEAARTGRVLAVPLLASSAR